jgi:retron-type reverse transcriptase
MREPEEHGKGCPDRGRLCETAKDSNQPVRASRSTGPTTVATVLQLVDYEEAPMTDGLSHGDKQRGSNTAGITDINKMMRDLLLQSWNPKTSRYSGILTIAARPEVLRCSYEQVRTRKGATTPAGDSSSLDAALHYQIPKISQALLSGSYSFGRGRRSMIPKPSGGERPLTVIPAWDKMVLNAIKMVLEPIYEGLSSLVPEQDPKGESNPSTNTGPQASQETVDTVLPSDSKRRASKCLRRAIFHPASHGFRPKRSCHSALRDTQSWSLVSWLIDIDIAKCFDRINQNRLINIMEETVDDPQLRDLLYKMFNAEIANLELGGPDPRLGFGVPQGNPLSPLLCNIYLTKFDYKLAELKSEIDVGTGRVLSKERLKAVYIPKSWYKSQPKPKRDQMRREVRNNRISIATKAGITKYVARKDGKEYYRRLHFVRYADDFLIGLRGDKTLAINTRDRLVQFLKEDLHLEVKKAELIHARSQPALFLGFHIQSRGDEDQHVTYSRKQNAVISLRRRAAARRDRTKLAFGAYVDKVAHTSLAKGLVQARGVLGSPPKAALRSAGKKAGLQHALDATEAWLHAKAKEIAELKAKVNAAHPEGYADSERCGSEQQPSDISSAHALEMLDRLERESSSEFATEMKYQLSQLRALDGLEEIRPQVKNLMEQVSDKALNRKLALVTKGARTDAPNNAAKLYATGKKAGACLRINIPMDRIRERLREWHMTRSNSVTPKFAGPCLKYHDVAIIDHFAAKARGLVNYYRPAQNFHLLRKMVNYQMRYSLLHTLAAKHKKTLKQTIAAFGSDPAVFLVVGDRKDTPRRGDGELASQMLTPTRDSRPTGKRSRSHKGGRSSRPSGAQPVSAGGFQLRCIAAFPTRQEVNQMKRGFTMGQDDVEGARVLDRPIIRLSLPNKVFDQCAVTGCTSQDIQVHHVSRLRRKVKNYIIKGVDSAKGRPISGYHIIESALNRKQIPLCKKHHDMVHSGELDLTHLSAEFFNPQSVILGSSKLVLRTSETRAQIK